MTHDEIPPPKSVKRRNRADKRREEKTPPPPPARPVGFLPCMASLMKVDLVVSQKSDVWILHDRPIDGVLRWVEYDPATAAVTLVMENGNVQDLGLPLSEPMCDCLEDATIAYAILMGEKYIKDMYRVPLVTRTADFN